MTSIYLNSDHVTLSSGVEDDAELTTRISSAEQWDKANSLEKEDNELFWNTL